MRPIAPLQQCILLLLSKRHWNSTLADQLNQKISHPIESINEPAQHSSEDVAAI